MGGILRSESRHMPVKAKLAHPNYVGDLSRRSFAEHQVNGYNACAMIYSEAHTVQLTLVGSKHLQRVLGDFRLTYSRIFVAATEIATSVRRDSQRR